MPIDQSLNQTTLPASHAYAITPSDSTILTPTRGLWIGVGGAIKVDTVGGETAVTFSGIPSGTLLPIAVTKVYSTNTTASSIVGLY